MADKARECLIDEVAVRSAGKDTGRDQEARAADWGLRSATSRQVLIHSAAANGAMRLIAVNKAASNTPSKASATSAGQSLDGEVHRRSRPTNSAN